MSAPWVPDLNCETHEWRSALGDVVRFVTRTEAGARMMPPVTVHTLRVPQAQGGRFRFARHEERMVTIPVVLPGPITDRAELRRWARALDPLQGEGTLTVVQGAHPGRQLVCVYEAGLDTWTEDEPSIGLTTLGFHAADPYWQDGTESQLRAALDTTAFTWFPFLPLVLGASDVYAAATIDNAGDVDAWPVVTITGPGDSPTVRNDTTGKHFTIPLTLSATDSLIIDTRPGHKQARTGQGVNIFQYLTDDSTMWSLAPGGNRITIGMSSATVASSVVFGWRNRWLAA